MQSVFMQFLHILFIAKFMRDLSVFLIFRPVFMLGLLGLGRFCAIVTMRVICTLFFFGCVCDLWDFGVFVRGFYNRRL
jgi:hypothetical protein